MMTHESPEAQRIVLLEADRAARTRALLAVEQEVVELRAQVRERTLVIAMRDREIAALRAQLAEREGGPA